ncbi:MAG: response regulator [Candidatus Hydrogenedentota bacterium]
MKALVVDDSSVMRRVLLGALARVNVTDVDQAVTGEHAIDLASTRSHGLILLDWSMPDIPGIEVLRSIRLRGVTAPVIMVSTEAERGRVLEAFKAGANDYVIKPFETATMINKIQTIIAQLSLTTDRTAAEA